MRKALCLALFALLIGATVTSAQVPATPTLTSPAAGAVGVSTTPTLTWNTVANALTYEAEISTAAGFAAATIVFDSTTITAGTVTLTTSLTAATLYYWRVRAANATGTSAWSATRIFRTAGGGGIPATPTLTAPANNATGVSITPTFTWTAGVGVNPPTAYEIQISANATFTSVVLDSSVTAATVTLSNALTPATTYYWRVNASNANGTSAYSAANTFTTGTGAPATPVLTAPANGATGVSLTPAFTWGSVGAATSYTLEIAANATFTTLILDSTVTVESLTPATPLTASTTYYWRVSASNAVGSSAYSAARTFTTGTGAPAVPVLTAPANGATGQSLTPTLTWGTVATATSYTVELATNAAFTTVVLDSSVTAGTVTLSTPLTATTTYYWRVSASSATGTSAYSAARTFTTGTGVPATPTLTAPAAGAVGQLLTPTFTWTTVVAATSYRLQISANATFTSLVLNDSTLTAGTLTLTTPLNASTTYYWRVNASDAFGTSAYTAARNFTTGTGLPATPTLSAPASGATGVSTKPTFTWTTVAGATSYRLQVSANATFTTIVVNDSALTAATLTLTTSLAVNTTYYWRVAASNAYGTGAWTAAMSFTTTPTGVIQRANYTSASAGLRGVAEIYLSNGVRVMERAFDASAAKDQVLSTMSKNLAKGYYIYRLRVNSQVVESGPVLIK